MRIGDLCRERSECGDIVPFGQAAVVNDTCAARSAGEKAAAGVGLTRVSFSAILLIGFLQPIEYLSINILGCRQTDLKGCACMNS